MSEREKERVIKRERERERHSFIYFLLNDSKLAIISSGKIDFECIGEKSMVAEVTTTTTATTPTTDKSSDATETKQFGTKCHQKVFHKMPLNDNLSMFGCQQNH